MSLLGFILVWWRMPDSGKDWMPFSLLAATDMMLQIAQGRARVSS